MEVFTFISILILTSRCFLSDAHFLSCERKGVYKECRAENSTVLIQAYPDIKRKKTDLKFFNTGSWICRTPGIITVTADSFSDVQDVRSLHIECVQFRGFPTPFINQEYLERIDFLDNHFTEFPREFCANISSIKSIRVNYQQITKLSATSFSSIASYLQNLELGHIQLKIIEPNTFSRFRYLKNLRLNGNQLEILRPDMFDNLSFLETLDLGENVIRTIKPETFSALTRLRALFLQSNHLRNLPQKIFSDLLNLEMLYLHGNRFIKDPIDLVTGLLQLTDYSGVVNKTLNVYQ